MAGHPPLRHDHSINGDDRGPGTEKREQVERREARKRPADPHLQGQDSAQGGPAGDAQDVWIRQGIPQQGLERHAEDRKSTRLNSSHLVISYAVFCLKKKKKKIIKE